MTALKVCDQMAITFPCFIFLHSDLVLLLQTSVLSEFGMTSIICVLKITLKAFEDLSLYSIYYWYMWFLKEKLIQYMWFLGKKFIGYYYFKF